MDFSNSYPHITAMQPFLAVLCAIAIEKFWPIPTSVNPLSLFRFLCQQIAKRVFAVERKQAVISGSLSLAVLVLPVVTIVWIVREFAGYPWLFDCLLLWVALQFRQDMQNISRAIDNLAQGKTQLAKETLQLTVLRQTQNLSSIGLCKAALESIYQRYQYQQITCIFVYLILGPSAALFYRLCLEAQQIWNIKLPHYRYFGLSAHLITTIIQVIPVTIFNISFLLLISPKHALKHICTMPFWRAFKQTVLLQKEFSLSLQCLTLVLQVNTGGPCHYKKANPIGMKQNTETKLPRLRYSCTTDNPHKIYALKTNIKNSNEPSTTDIKRLIKTVNQHLITTVLIYGATLWCVTFLFVA